MGALEVGWRDRRAEAESEVFCVARVLTCSADLQSKTAKERGCYNTSTILGGQFVAGDCLLGLRSTVSLLAEAVTLMS